MTTPLTVSEARAILAAEEAFEASGHRLGAQERAAWAGLVASARDRVVGFEDARRRRA